MNRRIASIGLGAILCVLSASTGPLSAADAPDNAARPQLKVALSAKAFSGVDTSDARASMKTWMEQQVVSGNQYSVRELRIVADDAQLLDVLEKKEVNFVATLAVDYIRLRDNELIGKDNKAGASGSALDEYVLIVSRDGDIKGLKGLKQKKVIVQVGGLGEVPTIWLDTVFMKEGVPIASQFCREVKLVPKASAAVLPVFFGQADACVVVKKAFMTMAELNPQIGKRLTVIAQSGRFPRNMSWFTGEWDKENAGTCCALMMDTADTPLGRQFLALMAQESMVVWEPADLAPLEALLKEHDELSRKAKEATAQGDGEKPADVVMPQPPVTDNGTAASLAKDR